MGKKFLIVWALLMTFIAGGLTDFEAMRLLGKTNLDNKSATSAPMMGQTESGLGSSSANWQPDWVRYNGEIYDYNEDITTFLIMGIDKDDEEVQKAPEGDDGGQADALFLLVINPHDESIKVIGINRNSMTDVDIYDEYGRYQTTIVAQIALQHAYGDGMEESCEHQVKAVSNMFYQLPIHGYAAINMSAIPTLNDQVGGVDVEVLEDLTKFDKSLVKGEFVHLMGMSAFYYCKARDVNVYGSNDLRLERQRQYINGFIAAVRAQTKDNPNAAVDLFKSVKSMMVTDITVDEISYLAPMVSGYSFNTNDLRMVEGKTQKTYELEEFIVDEDDLYKLILEIFYEKVGNAG